MSQVPSKQSAKILVVMGVSGCGKSTVGRAVAERIQRPFLDADDYHPAANVEKMSRGIPLVDEDRWPWLDILAETLLQRAQSDEVVVCACSALRRVYRDRLQSASNQQMLFIYLQGDVATIAARLSHRSDHFMPTSLLESQFAALEPPTSDEQVIVVPIGESVESLVDSIVQQIAE